MAIAEIMLKTSGAVKRCESCGRKWTEPQADCRMCRSIQRGLAEEGIMPPDYEELENGSQ